MELTEFLNVRLDAAEETAQSAGESRIAWLTYVDAQGRLLYTTVADGHGGVWVADGKELPEPSSVLVVYDTAEVLADIEAKRAFLDFAVRTRDLAERQPTQGQAKALRQKWASYLTALKFTALPYASHPDYEEAWRP